METSKQNKAASGFLKQGSILAAASILVRIIGMIYRIPMANIIGDEGNGVYSAAFEIYNILLTTFQNIFPFCDLSKCGLTGVFLYFGTAPVSENPPKKIPLKENLSKTYFSENKKTHLRNIHCPTDMSENFHICCRFTRPGPTPSSISGIACSVCTVDLAFC